MTIVPEGTLDPSVYLYDSTMYAMSAALALAVICNSLIRPVHPKHHLPMPVNPPPKTLAGSTISTEKMNRPPISSYSTSCCLEAEWNEVEEYPSRRFSSSEQWKSSREL
jgi:hypothetical protein